MDRERVNVSYHLTWRRSQPVPVYIPCRHRGFTRLQWANLRKFDKVMREMESTVDPYDDDYTDDEEGTEEEEDNDNNYDDEDRDNNDNENEDDNKDDSSEGDSHCEAVKGQRNSSMTNSELTSCLSKRDKRAEQEKLQHH